MNSSVKKIMSMSFYKTSLLLLMLMVMLSSIGMNGQLLAQNEETLSLENIAPEEESGFRTRIVDFDKMAEPEGFNSFFKNDNWTLRLNSSSEYIMNKRLTFSKNTTNIQGKNLMGVRVNFPDLPSSAYATLQPPAPFNFYQLPAEGESPIGLVTNVGAVRSIISRVAGRNYPYTYSMHLRRNDGQKQLYILGNLLFLGWKELRWDNPYYIEDLRLKTLTLDHLYPRVSPSIRLESVQFYRDGTSRYAGDFVTYLEFIDLIYDKAFSESELEELKAQDDYVDDDAIWEIYSNEFFKTENLLLQEKIKNFRYLEKLERDKVNLPPMEETSDQ